jgi:hypothetical protein
MLYCTSNKILWMPCLPGHNMSLVHCNICHNNCTCGLHSVRQCDDSGRNDFVTDNHEGPVVGGEGQMNDDDGDSC